jgi:hypothetical protein
MYSFANWQREATFNPAAMNIRSLHKNNRLAQAEILIAALIIALHLANVLVPAMWYDEAVHVNVAATMATLGEYGNTWQAERPVIPDRLASTGLAVTGLASLAWKCGFRGPVSLRLLSVTPFFVGFVLLLGKWLSVLDAKSRLLALVLVIGVPEWAFLSSRVLGEFPAICFTLAGALLVFQSRLVLGSLLWGLAAATKLVFAPGLICGWLAWSLAARKPLKSVLLVIANILAPIALLDAVLWLRYGAVTDLALSAQSWIVLFWPRNFPLHLAVLNQMLPWVLLSIGYVYAWTMRKTLPQLWFLCSLSSFWTCWFLLGFRDWTRYLMPALMFLIPPIAAGLADIFAGAHPLHVKIPLAATAAAFVFVGLYNNTYSIWTSYKEWRDEKRVAAFLLSHRDRQLLGEGETFPYPDYQWLTGLRFLPADKVTARSGAIAVLRKGANSFVIRELNAGRGGDWRFLFATSAMELYEKK